MSVFQSKLISEAVLQYWNV